MKLKFFISITALLLFIGVDAEAVYRFWDLANTTGRANAHVKVFDENTNKGGGYFIFYNRTNTGIQEIAGYRIKLAGTTKGYWERAEPLSNFNVEWCGASNDPAAPTLTSLGVSQGTANTYWGLDYDNVTPLVDVTRQTYDEAAIRYAFKIMEESGFHTLNFNPLPYYMKDGANLPRVYNFVSAYNETSRFKINGNGAAIMMTNTSGSRSAFRTYPINQDDCDGANQEDGTLRNLQTRKFYISGFTFYGAGGTSSDTAIFIGCSYGDVIEKNTFWDFAVGIRSEFTLEQVVQFNEFNRMSYCGTIHDNGSWAGAGWTDANCHKSKLIGNRHYGLAGAYAHNYVGGTSGMAIVDPIYEGGKQWYHVFFDDYIDASGGASTTIRTFRVERAHIEAPVDSASIYVKLTTGTAIIDQLHPDDAFWNNATGGYLIAGTPQVGQAEITVDRVANLVNNYYPANPMFATKNNMVWHFYRCKGKATYLTASYWEDNAYYNIPSLGERITEESPNLP